MLNHKKVAAIIAEYNPFHNGHEYHIKKTRELCGADYIIVLMSTNFVQRGEAAILDRYERAEAAILHGADAVFELPLMVSLGSADIFSLGACALADHLGFVDYLSFGAETADVTLLWKTANLLYENEELETTLKEKLRGGLTFPESRESYLLQNGYKKEARLLQSPNNILAITYLHSLLKLKSNLQAFPIKREGAKHHSSQLIQGNISSAMAIRTKLRNLEAEQTLSYLPETSANQIKNRDFLSNKDFSSLLFYKLNSLINGYEKKEAIRKLSSIQYITEDLAGRIYHTFSPDLNFDNFANCLWGKNYTLTRMNRALYHLLFDIKKDFMKECEVLHFCPYFRPLAIRKSAITLLKELKRKEEALKLPLLTRISDEKKLQNTGKLCFQKTLEANQLYLHLSLSKNLPFRYDEKKERFMKLY